MENLTIIGLGARETDEVVVFLVREGLWDWHRMIYDDCASLLMTTTDEATRAVLAVAAKLGFISGLTVGVNT